MAANKLSTEAIALTEKKMDMTLGMFLMVFDLVLLCCYKPSLGIYKLIYVLLTQMILLKCPRKLPLKANRLLELR